MSIPAIVVVGLIAVLHAYIAVFEMFFWVERGPKIFDSFDVSLFEPTKAMAFNQGVYNSFLAAGLVWSMAIDNDDWQRNVATCFLIMVAVAGIAGGLTIGKRILFIQTVPAVIGLILVWIS